MLPIAHHLVFLRWAGAHQVVVLVVTAAMTFRRWEELWDHPAVRAGTLATWQAAGEAQQGHSVVGQVWEGIALLPRLLVVVVVLLVGQVAAAWQQAVVTAP